VTDTRHLRRDAGFTLVELLIALGIGVTITAAMGAVLILGLGTTEEAGAQVQEAAWAQVVGAFFLADVHGAEDTSASTFGCYEDPPDYWIFLHRFEWVEPEHWPPPPDPEDEDEDSLPPPRTLVDWWADTGDGILMRTVCLLVTSVDEDTDEIVEEVQLVEAAPVAFDTDVDPTMTNVTCTSAACTIVWTVARDEDSAGADRIDRTYEMTALRRLP
jgi:hypothetical protein